MFLEIFLCNDVKSNFFKNKKNIIFIFIQLKTTLKNNYYYILIHI